MQAGERVGPFDIEKRIGSGAMGAVYRARYRKTGQHVAIKVMASGLDGNATALARFEREAEVLKQLNHRNIVRFFVASQYQGSPYYAMEFIEGEPLDRILHRRGRVTWEEVVEVGKQICAALQHAHDQGIVHRDLKPSNMMILPDGTLKLTDFGIAKDLDVTQLTSANCTVGTAAYMSPEQCKGERNLTYKSDLYSLGVVFYELLTGEKPFKAETTMDMFLQHVQGTFERPSRIILDIPVWLDTLVCQLMEKKPEHRPYDAAMVAQALDQVAEKVATLQSAGVDVAKSRIVDRLARRDVRLDETDKRVARTLLTSMKGRRRKKNAPPIYERGWFQGIGLSALLAGIGAILWVAFRPPSPEVLFQRAQSMLAKENTFEGRRQARSGPIKEYLERYSALDTEQTAQIRRWYDEILAEEAWRGLTTRVTRGAEWDMDTVSKVAWQKEKDGDLEGALNRWQSLVKNKEQNDELERGQRLLAEKRVAAIQLAQGVEEDLTKRVTAGSPDTKFSDEEKQAIDALRLETAGDYVTAFERWDRARLDRDSSTGPGPIALLAAKKVKDLKDKQPKDDKGKLQLRLQVIRNLLDGATKQAKTNPQEAIDVCKAIEQLYAKEPDSEVTALVKKAQDLSKQVQGGSEAKGVPSATSGGK
jgi:serine/threonine-protein kinase